MRTHRLSHFYGLSLSTQLIFVSILIFPALYYQEECGHDRSHNLGDDDREPNAVEVEEYRQYQHRRDLKNEGSQEGDYRRDETVIEGGEESRAPDGNAREEEGEGVNIEAVDGHIEEPLVVADEDLR